MGNSYSIEWPGTRGARAEQPNSDKQSVNGVPAPRASKSDAARSTSMNPKSSETSAAKVIESPGLAALHEKGLLMQVPLNLRPLVEAIERFDGPVTLVSKGPFSYTFPLLVTRKDADSEWHVVVPSGPGKIADCLEATYDDPTDPVDQQLSFGHRLIARLRAAGGRP